MTMIVGFVLVLAAAVAPLAWRLHHAHRSMGRLRERIGRMEREAAHADEARQRLLTSVTHELRTPLTAILGYQELITDGFYGEIGVRCREPMARIGSAAGHLLHLIDGLLELARLDAGRLELNLASVRVGDVIRRAVESARIEAADQNAGLEVDSPDVLPRITTDSDRLRRALELALVAAVRSAAGGTLRVRVRPDADGVVVEIAGARLQPDPTPSEREGGDDRDADEGLRLSIALRLARRLGGDLRLVPNGDATTLRLRIRDAPLLVRASGRDG